MRLVIWHEKKKGQLTHKEESGVRTEKFGSHPKYSEKPLGSLKQESPIIWFRF